MGRAAEVDAGRIECPEHARSNRQRFRMTEIPPNPTRIYVDADACPVKDEIYRVAERHQLPVTVVAATYHPRAAAPA